MHRPDHDPDTESHGAPGDAELAGLEAALAAALGGAAGSAEGAALAAFGDPRPHAATPARPSFRSSLRASFVSGRFEGDGAPPAVVVRALDAEVVPSPGGEFRASLRARFLAAHTDEAPGAPLALLRLGAEQAGPSAGSLRGAQGAARRGRGHAGERTPGAPGTGARRWPRFAAIAALAAALLAALLLRGPLADFVGRTGAPAATRWTLYGQGPLVGLLVDGAPVADQAALEARLRSGAALETGAHGLRLAVGRDVVIELGPGTRARVPRYSAGAGLTLELERGALRVATGADFQPPGGGRRLAVVTPHAEALAVGTLFGVDCTPEYTCVCCYEGEALTRSLLAGGGEGRVAAGRTRLVYVDGRVRDLELVSHHRAPLVELSEAWRT